MERLLCPRAALSQHREARLIRVGPRTLLSDEDAFPAYLEELASIVTSSGPALLVLDDPEAALPDAASAFQHHRIAQILRVMTNARCGCTIVALRQAFEFPKEFLHQGVLFKHLHVPTFSLCHRQEILERTLSEYFLDLPVGSVQEVAKKIATVGTHQCPT